MSKAAPFSTVIVESTPNGVAPIVGLVASSVRTPALTVISVPSERPAPEIVSLPLPFLTSVGVVSFAAPART